MELNNVMLKLRDFIRDHFKVSDDDPDFNDDVHLFDYGYVDSFGAVELISFVENEFSVRITESDLIAFPLNSIREIASFAVNRLRGSI